MALTSPALTTAMPVMFGNIRPAINLLRRIGFTDFSAEAPQYDVKPGSTIKIPVSSVTAASAYNADSNNYCTGGDTDWATLTATHYLQGFDISGENVDEGVNAARMQQLFTYRAGKGIGAAALANARTALDALTLSTAVTLAASATVDEYQTLGSAQTWLNRADSVLVLNGAEYANLKKVFANEHVIGTDAELAAFIGFKDIVCLPGLTARAVIVPDGAAGFLARVPAIICDYKEFGSQTDDETGLSVGVVINEDKCHNRIIANADLWFGTATLTAPAGATTAGAIKVGTTAG